MGSLRWIVVLGAVLMIQASPLASGIGHAQVVDDAGVWYALFADGDVCDTPGPDNFKWWFDGHARFFDDAGGFGQSIVRPGIGYALSDHCTAWAGYGWIRTSPASRPDFDEHRIWQQLTGSTPLGPGTLGVRSRLEQRFLETGSDTGWRFRQLVSYRQPLAHSERYSLVAWDECFIHLCDTDWGANAGFDQNRLFLGIGRTCDAAGRTRIEIGYLNQFVHLPGRDDLSNHLLSINYYTRP